MAEDNCLNYRKERRAKRKRDEAYPQPAGGRGGGDRGSQGRGGRAQSNHKRQQLENKTAPKRSGNRKDYVGRDDYLSLDVAFTPRGGKGGYRKGKEPGSEGRKGRSKGGRGRGSGKGRGRGSKRGKAGSGKRR